MTPKQEKYCQAIASGMSELDAMHHAGFKASSQDNARRQLANLKKDEHVQNRIAELKAIAHIQSNDAKGVANLDKKTYEKVSALEFLANTYNDASREMKIRVQAAIAALPYEEAKLAPLGKKESKIEEAQKIAQ